MAATLRPHGTRSRYQAGCRCQPCRDAEADYRRGWVAAHPASARRTELRSLARGRALARLAKLHPHDYARLLDEERRRNGLGSTSDNA